MNGNGWKTPVENYLRLSIFSLNRLRILNGYQTWRSIYWGEDREVSISLLPKLEQSENSLILGYKIRGEDDEWNHQQYEVSLEKTTCNFGGFRFWFHCPRCNKRVAMLYLVRGRFTCRHCYNFTYNSRNISRGKYFFVHKMADKEEQAEKLYEGKRWQTQYKNEPTKRYRKYVELREKGDFFATLFLRYN